MQSVNIDPSQVMQWVHAHQWAPLIALAVGLAVRLVKDDGAKLPAPWRVPFGAFVSIAITASMSITSGGAWRGVLENALLALVLAITGHETFIEGMRGGVELPMPFLKPPSNNNSSKKDVHEETPPPPPDDKQPPPDLPKAA